MRALLATRTIRMLTLLLLASTFFLIVARAFASFPVVVVTAVVSMAMRLCLDVDQEVLA